MANNLKPFVNIGPGEFIQDEIDFRGWSQKDFADIIGISFQHLNDVINDKKQITIEMARKLSTVFEQSAQYWLNLNNNYQLRLQEDEEEQELILQRKEIYDVLPVAELIKKGFLPDKKHEGFFLVAKQLVDLCKSEFDLKEPSVAFRKSEANNNYNPKAAFIWYKLAQLEAEQMKVPMYSKDKLSRLAESIISYTTLDDGISLFISELRNAGVKFINMKHLEKTYVDGASFYNEDNPVIVYTMRYNRIDNFWFTIAHEIAHILLHFEDKSELYLDDTETACEDKKEQEANDYAMKMLGTDEVIIHFERYMRAPDQEIYSYANEVGLHPSIISGALKFAGLISQTRMNKKDFKVDKYLSQI